MTRHLLVPVDGSGFAEAALPTALSLTRNAGDVLELVMVQELGPVFALEAWEAAYPEAARAYLKDVAARFDAGSRDVRSTVLVGRPAAELQSYAAEAGADMVVMSTHGRGALSRVWLGSVADELVRHAHTPVVLVRPKERKPGLDDSAEPLFRRILVPVDGSERAEAALDCVRGLPDARDLQLTLLRIVRYPDELVSAYMPATIQMTQQVVDEGLQQAHDYLEQLRVRLAEERFAVETRASVESRPAAAILAYAEANDMDMIAMATHGRGGVPRAVMGSVTDKVVRGAHLPVMVVRPD